MACSAPKGKRCALAFSERRLFDAYLYLILDARYERVREGGVIVSQAVLIVVAVDWEGRSRCGACQPRDPVELARSYRCMCII